jgi:hypothetical protein
VPGLTKVYGDTVMAIYELPAPSPYFESTECRVASAERERVSTDCPAPGRLVRRELFFPGWRATVNGAAAPVGLHRDLFQEVTLPAGRSEVRFEYAPPGIGWTWLASGLGLLALAMGSLRRARRLLQGLNETSNKTSPNEGAL